LVQLEEGEDNGPSKLFWEKMASTLYTMTHLLLISVNEMLLSQHFNVSVSC